MLDILKKKRKKSARVCIPDKYLWIVVFFKKHVYHMS